MNENKAKVWVARDKNGGLWAYTSIPFRDNDMWNCDEPQCEIDLSKFPSVKWEDDEPTEAYITLANEPQSAKEIDWEQRRYEITKEMIVRKWLSDKIIEDRQFPYNENDDIASAIRYADRVINELKKRS